MKIILKLIAIAFFSIYMLALGYIPFLHFLHEYNTVLLLWCLLAVFVFSLFVFTLLRFSKLLLYVFISSIIALHALIFYEPNVRASFEIDSCLDAGGAWQNKGCLHE